MRKLMISAATMVLVAAPSLGQAQEEPPAESQEPGLLTTMGGAVGGALAATAGAAAGGPLGGAAASVAGDRVGRGVVGFVGKLFKRKKAEPPPAPAAVAAAPEAEAHVPFLDLPPMGAETAAADASAQEFTAEEPLAPPE